MATESMMAEFPGQGIGTEAFQDSVARSLLGPEGAVQDEIATEQPWLDGDELREATNEALTADDLNVDRRDEYEISPADEARAEFQAEQTGQFIEQVEKEQAAAEQEQAYNEALENYSKLTPEEQFEVSLESVGRGMESIAPVVNYEQAQVLSQELFEGAADPVPMATTLAYFADNVLQTLENAGITDTAQLTPEVAQQLNDPAMAHLFAQSLCQALRMPELLTDGIVNPVEMSVTLLPYVPVLLSGQSADLYPRDYKLAFAHDVCRAFGQKHMLRSIDPDAAVSKFDEWAKWGARLGAGLRAHRQQAQQAEQKQAPSRSAGRSTRTPRQAKPSSRFKTNSDLFDSEMEEAWQRQHGGV